MTCYGPISATTDGLSYEDTKIFVDHGHNAVAMVKAVEVVYVAGVLAEGESGTSGSSEIGEVVVEDGLGVEGMSDYS